MKAGPEHAPCRPRSLPSCLPRLALLVAAFVLGLATCGATCGTGDQVRRCAPCEEDFQCERGAVCIRGCCRSKDMEKPE